MADLEKCKVYFEDEKEYEDYVKMPIPTTPDLFEKFFKLKDSLNKFMTESKSLCGGQLC